MLFSHYSGLLCGTQDSPQGDASDIQEVRLIDASRLDVLKTCGKDIIFLGSVWGTGSVWGKFFMLFRCVGTASIVVSDTCAEFDEESYLVAIEVESGLRKLA